MSDLEFEQDEIYIFEEIKKAEIEAKKDKKIANYLNNGCFSDIKQQWRQK